MTFCKHQRHKIIDWIHQPKYSTDQVLIKTQAVSPEIEHYLLRFTNCNKYPDWLYFSSKDILRRDKQKNGAGEVYLVPMSCAKPFTPLTHCDHEAF